MLELSAQPLRLASFAHSSHRSGNRVASARAMRKQITFVTGNLKKREEVHVPLLQALLDAQIQMLGRFCLCLKCTLLAVGC